MTDLKPCPFCGGKAVSIVDPVGVVKLYQYYCGSCHTEIPASPDNKDAVKQWNNRPSPWVGVTDRLPEYNKFVLIRKEGRIDAVAFYHTSGNFADFRNEVFGYWPDYWMPIPPLEEK